MALTMTRPTKHPKSGVYRIRKGVPPELRDVLGKRELIQTLGTKDPQEAKRLAPPVVAKLEKIIANARSPRRDLSQAEIEGLIGVWYRNETARLGDNPGVAADWELQRDLMADQVEQPQGAYETPTIELIQSDLLRAEALLQAEGHAQGPELVRRVAEALFRARWELAKAMQSRAAGDYREDPNLARFPPPPSQSVPEVEAKAAAAVPWKALFDGWALEARPRGKRRYDRETVVAAFVRFVGHDDSARVTKADSVRWKDSRLKLGRAPATIARDLRMLSPLWDWAVSNGKLAGPNPFKGIAPMGARSDLNARRPYTDEEAAKLLTAARKEAGILRWLPWLACVTGARLGELAQSRKEDVMGRGDGGGWALRIHAEEEGRSLKRQQSARTIPLHPALIDEGFADYVAALPNRSPLFPDVGQDRFGRRSRNASRRHARWARRVLGEDDRTVDPAHGWRHWWRDAARKAGIEEAMAEALSGRAVAGESSRYGRGHRDMPETTAPHVAKITVPAAKASTAR